MKFFIIFLIFYYSLYSKEIRCSYGENIIHDYSYGCSITPPNLGDELIKRTSCTCPIPDGFKLVLGTSYKFISSPSYSETSNSCRSTESGVIVGDRIYDVTNITYQKCEVECDIPIPPEYVQTGVDCNEAPPVGKYTATMCGCPYNENGDAHLYGLPNPDYTPTPDNNQTDNNDTSTPCPPLGEYNMLLGVDHAHCILSEAVQFQDYSVFLWTSASWDSCRNTCVLTGTPCPMGQVTFKGVCTDVPNPEDTCLSGIKCNVVSVGVSTAETSFTQCNKRCYCDNILLSDVIVSCGDNNQTQPDEEEYKDDCCDKQRVDLDNSCKHGYTATCDTTTCTLIGSCKPPPTSLENNQTDVSDDYNSSYRDSNLSLDTRALEELINTSREQNNERLENINNAVLSVNDTLGVTNSKLDTLIAKNQSTNRSLDEIKNVNDLIRANTSDTASNTKKTATNTLNSANSLTSIDGKMTDLIDAVNGIDNNVSFENNGTGAYDKSMLDQLKKIVDLLDSNDSDDNSSSFDALKNELTNALDKYSNVAIFDTSGGCPAVDTISFNFRGSHIELFSQDTLNSLPMDMMRKVIIFLFAFSAITLVFRR